METASGGSCGCACPGTSHLSYLLPVFIIFQCLVKINFSPNVTEYQMLHARCVMCART